MNKRRRAALPLGTVLLFVASIALLLTSTIGGAQAALTYFSEVYNSQVELYNIGVTLMENGDPVAFRDYGNEADGNWEEQGIGLLGHLREQLGEEGAMQLGRAYPEVLTVKNSGSIDQFVRVNIYKYWVTVEDGVEEKCRDLSPDLIRLELDNLGDMWIEDEAAATAERTVLYYKEPLAVGEESLPFSKTLAIDGGVAKYVTTRTVQEDGRTVTRTTYDYNGVEFRLEVEANAVQTHNAEDAIISAWGRQVELGSNDRLALRPH